MSEALRAALRARPLDAGSAPTDPLALFARWLDEARAAALHLPEAMVLATVGEDGRPAARAVLLKGCDARGFAFYTHAGSRKGRELACRPFAALAVNWLELERQVRVEGAVSRLPDAEADAYFATRPRDSQLGAWASPQSEPLASRAELERRVAEAAARFSDRFVPRPPHWGGYVVAPESVEFWQGRPGRLHDRLRYVRGGDGAYALERLAP